jgi:SAM-dependent methyltransferase
MSMKKLLLRPVVAAENLRLWLLDQPWFMSVLLPALPRRFRWFLRKAYLTPIDLADRLLGRRDPGLPPKAGNFTGGALHEFAERGEAFVQALSDVAGATPSSHVLDVGCGFGKLAIGMSKFLDDTGRYDGFDIVPEAIQWCKENITGPHNNINFTLADIYNKEYNPKGSVQGRDYRFPYEDDTFDVVALYSVFTHMLPKDVEHYISEIARVLKRGGRVFATYFVITPETLRLMKASKSGWQFKEKRGPYWVQGGRVEELALAYEEEFIHQTYAKYGISTPKAYLGEWCGRAGHWSVKSGLAWQDALVATKE